MRRSAPKRPVPATSNWPLSAPCTAKPNGDWILSRPKTRWDFTRRRRQRGSSLKQSTTRGRDNWPREHCRQGVPRRLSVLAPGSRPLEPELFDAIADLVAIQAEKARGLRLIPIAALERLGDKRSFELLQVHAGGRQ